MSGSGPASPTPGAGDPGGTSCPPFGDPPDLMTIQQLGVVQGFETEKLVHHESSFHVPVCLSPNKDDSRCYLPRPPALGAATITSPWDRQASHLQPLYQFHGEGGGDALAVVGSVEGGSPTSGGDEGSSTPAAVQWSRSLQVLLDDAIGVQLFTKFLNEEIGSDVELQFLFACNGLKNKKITDCKVSRLVPMIFQRFIQKDVWKPSADGLSRVMSPNHIHPDSHRKIKISSSTYIKIKESMETDLTNIYIFDQAQKEVEDEMSSGTYPSFLKSELYLSHLPSTHHSGFHSPSSPTGLGGGGFLETVPEDSEIAPHDDDLASGIHTRLTQEALAATVHQRVRAEPRHPEVSAGHYMRYTGGYGYGISPYHAQYHSGHQVSRHDSRQSLSSGALTDETLSRTDSSSVDGYSVGYGQPIKTRHAKRQHHKMIENARQNSSNNDGVCLPQSVVPRTSKLSKEKTNPPKPEDFAKELCERLGIVKRDQENQEKINISFKKIQEGDDSTDEYRRQYARNALPPLVLLDKLDKIPLEDQAPCQSILDEHVSRVWQDSNQASPSYTPGGKTPPLRGAVGGKSFPHQLPRPTASSSSTGSTPTVPPPHHFKGSVNVGRLHPSKYQSIAYAPVGGGGSHQYPSLHQLPPGIGGLPPTGAHVYPLNHPYQASKSWYHANKRREKGPDVTSTFSSDSGNVADYYEISDRVPPPHSIRLPKSRSMPEYMENYTNPNSDGGSSGRRQGSSGRRSSSRRPPADLTDSGVSVVSDSGQSLVPSSSTERVESWLQTSNRFMGSPCGEEGGGGGGGCSVSVQVLTHESYHRESSRSVRPTRSTHTSAGSTSPGTVRRSGRRSVAANVGGGDSISGHSVGVGRSTSLDRGDAPLPPGGLSTATAAMLGYSVSPATSTITPHYHHQHNHHSESGAMVHLHGGGTTTPHYIEDKRKSRSSGISTYGDTPLNYSSNGSTLKKQHRLCRYSASGQSASDSTGGGGGGSSSSNSGSCRGLSTTTPTIPSVVTSTQLAGVISSGASTISMTTPLDITTSTITTPTPTTTVIYNFQDDDDIPFVTKITTKSVTLRRFKQHLPKRGNYRFFFKTHCEEFGIIQEEITEDNEVLPLFEGRIFAQIRKAD